MKLYLLYVLNLILVTCMGLIEPHSGSIKQTLAKKCRNLNDCPAYFGMKEQAYYQQTCCPPGSIYTWHCIEHRDKMYRRNVISACVDPLTCEAGTYALLNQTTVDGQIYAWVQCLPCEHGHFEPYPRPSYLFRFSVCSDTWQECYAKHGKIQTKIGTSKLDRHCRCLWENGYVPSNNITECRSLDGFSKASDCYCIRKACPSGYAINQDFVCAPETTTTTTPAPTSPMPPVTSSKKPGKGNSSKTTRTQSTALPIILLIIAAFICGMGLPWVCIHLC